MENESNSFSQDTNVNNKEKKREKGFYLKIIALALCCSLLGGLIGCGTVFLTGNYLAEKELNELLETNDGFIFGNRLKINNPIWYTLGAIKNYVEDEIIREQYIGISVTDSSEPDGSLVDSVEKGSPAAKGGLQEGDIITMVNNVKIYDSDDLSDFIDNADIGDELHLTVYRAEETIDCTVVIGEQSRFGD